MGFLEKAKGMASKAVDQHGDKIAKAIDHGASAANKRTRNKHSGQVDQAAARAKQALRKRNGTDDDQRPGF